MKVLLILACLIAPLCARYEPVQSVRPLQAIDFWGKKHNFCTTSSINAKEGYFLTAAHCTALRGMFGEPIIPVVDDKETTLLKVDYKHDVAIILGPKGIPALRFAKHAPKNGAEIYMIGFPIGIGEPQFFFGHISNVRTPDERKDVAMLLDIEGCHGNSGSAVLNKDGEVVGVLQFLVTDYENDQRCGHWMGSLTYEDLMKFVKGYAQ